jgi:hypothetical protein
LISAPKNLLFYWPAGGTSAQLAHLNIGFGSNWLCLGLFSPSVQFDISLINPCNEAACVHLTFSQIGFVLHNLVKMIGLFLALATDFADFTNLVNVLCGLSFYPFSHLLISL